jgi:hypothetical protein
LAEQHLQTGRRATCDARSCASWPRPTPPRSGSGSTDRTGHAFDTSGDTAHLAGNPLGGSGNAPHRACTSSHRSGHSADTTDQAAQEFVAVLRVQRVGNGLFQGIYRVDFFLGELVAHFLFLETFLEALFESFLAFEFLFAFLVSIHFLHHRVLFHSFFLESLLVGF